MLHAEKLHGVYILCPVNSMIRLCNPLVAFAGISAQTGLMLKLSISGYGLSLVYPFRRNTILSSFSGILKSTIMILPSVVHSVVTPTNYRKKLMIFALKNRYPSRSAATLELIRRGMEALKKEQKRCKKEAFCH